MKKTTGNCTKFGNFPNQGVVTRTYKTTHAETSQYQVQYRDIFMLIVKKILTKNDNK